MAQDEAVEGEVVEPGQQGRASEVARSTRHLAPTPAADAVAVKPFGWEPQGRLAELARRRDPDEYLSTEALNLIFKGVPVNTRRTYQLQWRKFVRWCGETGRNECPATPATVIEYMNHLWRTPGRRGRPTAPSHVQLALSVIAIAHQRARRPEADERGQAQYGYVSPTTHPDVRLAKRGYTEQWLQAGHRPDISYALPPDELIRMVGTLDHRSVVGVFKATMLAVGYAMGARRSEIGAINMTDVELHLVNGSDDPDQVVCTLDHQDYMVITVPMSKTDISGQGAEVFAYAAAPADAAMCPVRWTLRWLAWRRQQGIPDEGPFMLAVRQGNRPPKDGRPRSGRITAGLRVTGETLEDIMADTAVAAGLKDVGTGRGRRITPHSLRSGPATYAGEEGADTPALNAHFRWSPAGTTAAKYVRAAGKKRLNPQRKIVLARERRRQQGREEGGGQE